MKKLIFLEIFIFVAIFTALSFSRSPIDEVSSGESAVSGETTELTGMATYFGNVPFEYLGIKADDGKTYRLEIGKNCRNPEGAPATESDISKLQGWKIKFSGKISDDEAGPQTKFIVESFEVMK